MTSSVHRPRGQNRATDFEWTDPQTLEIRFNPLTATWGITHGPWRRAFWIMDRILLTTTVIICRRGFGRPILGELYSGGYSLRIRDDKHRYPTWNRNVVVTGAITVGSGATPRSGQATVVKLSPPPHRYHRSERRGLLCRRRNARSSRLHSHHSGRRYQWRYERRW